MFGVTGPSRKAIAVLVLLTGLVAGAVASNNGALRPLNGNEIFVAQTASEMLERDEYLVPHFAGALRLEKPPLPYWLSAVSHAFIGAPESTRVTEAEARLPALVSGLLLIGVTFLLGTAAFNDRRIGLVAAAILATSWQFFTYTRSARPEMLYALFCTVQMLGLVIAARRTLEGRSGTPAAVLAWLAAAAALLAKGPQFPMFFIAGAVAALRFVNPRPSVQRIIRPDVGLAIVAVVALYFVFLATQSEGVAAFWLRQATQVRSLDDPLWLRPLRFFYPMSLVLAFAPWAVPLGLAAVQCWRDRQPMALMLAFPILLSLFFLGFAGTHRGYYVLPLVPLCAALGAWACVTLFDRARLEAGARKLLGWLLLVQALLVGALLVANGWRAQMINPVSGAAMLPGALAWLCAGAGFVIVALVVARRRPASAFGAVVAAILSAWTAISVSGLDVSRYWATSAEFAARVAAIVPKATPLVFGGTQENSIVYYGKRRQTRMDLRDWIAANGTANPPLLVCVRACRADGYELDGRVLLQQRYLRGQETYQILFQPSRIRAASPR